MKCAAPILPLVPLPSPVVRVALIGRITAIDPILSELALCLPPRTPPSAEQILAHFKADDQPFLPLQLLVRQGKHGFSLAGGLELASVTSVLLQQLERAKATFLIYPTDLPDTALRAAIFRHWLLHQSINASIRCDPRQALATTMRIAHACGIGRNQYTLSHLADVFGLSERTAKRATKLLHFNDFRPTSAARNDS